MRNNTSGVALVLALVILILMMSSVLLLGGFLREELKMSLSSTDSMAAFYAADSGLEKSLYYLKYGVAQGDLTFFNQLESNSPFNISGFAASYDYTAATTISPASTWSELAQGQHTFSAQDIEALSTAQVSILDPTGEVTGINWGPNAAAVNYSYLVAWKIADCFPSHSSDQLEISYTSFADSFSGVENKSHLVVCNCSFDSQDWCDDSLSQFNISDARYYRFIFRPLDGAVEEIGFDIFEDGEPIGVPSEAYIAVEGRYHQSQYGLQARLPAINPLSDVFNYIIFTEEPLIKDL